MRASFKGDGILAGNCDGTARVRTAISPAHIVHIDIPNCITTPWVFFFFFFFRRSSVPVAVDVGASFNLTDAKAATLNSTCPTTAYTGQPAVWFALATTHRLDVSVSVCSAQVDMGTSRWDFFL